MAAPLWWTWFCSPGSLFHYQSKRLLMENYKSAAHLGWGNDIKREEHEKLEKMQNCIFAEREGIVVTRKSRLRWCLWCSGSSAWGSITPPIKGSSTLHLMACCGWCHLQWVALQIYHDAKHGVQNILLKVSESRKVTDVSMNERLQGNTFICALSFKKLHCFTRSYCSV